jgi:transcriptional regulator with XRE-family HTH domain
MSAGIVYVLQCGEYYKIGRTQNLPQRVSDLQMSNPFPIAVIHTWETVAHQRLERRLHQRLSHAKVRGEWFRLTADEILALKAITAEAFEEGPAAAPPRDRTLPENAMGRLLPPHGVPSIIDLARGLGLRKQYAWLLWHGKIALSLELLRRIHATFGVPVEVLMQVTRATPAKRRGRHPQKGGAPQRPAGEA